MKEMPGHQNPGRNDLCWCGSGKKFKKCHLPRQSGARGQTARSWTPTGAGQRKAHSTLIKTKAQIEGIRRAGRLNCEILDMLEEKVREGVTSEEIDRWVYDLTLSRGAVPATLNYKGYTKSTCISVNEVVCHGIPDGRVLRAGDIVNVDVSSRLDGFFGDSSRMFLIGDVGSDAKRLVEATAKCLELGIAQVKPGNFVGDIGFAIQSHATKEGFSVVRDFVGHGTGVQFHEEPQIPHFGQKGKGHPLLPGMVFTIEPMINQGRYAVEILADGWTAVTKDRSLSAQFEHTVLVTPGGVEIMTV